LVHKVEPKYPEAAKKVHAKGPVIVQILISESGTVQEARVVQGDPLLEQAATNAVREWRYKPTTINGRPVQVETIVELKFH
jgi:periplasmic protein TonB